jgi:hypothetical protein
MADARVGKTATGDASLTAENERLRAERDELQARLARSQGQPARGGFARRSVVVVLVVVAVLSFVVASVGVFARRNFLDTDRWVERVGPLAEEPAVQDALARRLTDEAMVLIDPAALFEEVLPERGRVLAVPLANAVRGFVGDRIDAFFASEEFSQLWVAANEQAHRAAVRVLRGESDVVAAQDGTVTINLVPIVNEALRRVGEASPEIVGREVDLPTLTVDDLPEVAVARLEDATGVDLDDDFGQITVYSRGRLEAAQDVLRLFERGVVVAVVLAVVSIAAALALSHTRRRTLLQILIGIVLLLVLLRRVVFRLEDEVLDKVRIEENVPAVKAVLAAFADPFLEGTVWIIGIAVAIAVVALVTAPYAWAVTLRKRTAVALSSIVGAAGTLRERAGDESTVRWVAAHRSALQVAGAIAAVVMLWLFDLSWIGVLVVLALVAAYELAVVRVADAAGAAGPTEA